MDVSTTYFVIGGVVGLFLLFEAGTVARKRVFSASLRLEFSEFVDEISPDVVTAFLAAGEKMQRVTAQYRRLDREMASADAVLRNGVSPGVPGTAVVCCVDTANRRTLRTASAYSRREKMLKAVCSPE